MATIATHNGSSVSRGHNMRKDEIVSKEPHIDPDGIHETWHDEAPRQAYERLFGHAVKEYNLSQKRSDRKIKNYYNEVCADQRRHVTYEMIIGVYPGKDESITEGAGRGIMREFVSTWHLRNPNLELVGAYYHADEQGRAPHVHIDYIPVAHGYKRGPAVQNGLVKALGEMGFSKSGKATAQIQWEKRENEVLESLCNSRGISVEHPQEGHGAKHLHTQAYKAEQELRGIKNDIEFHKDRVEHQRELSRSLSKQARALSGEATKLDASVATLRKERDSLERSVSHLQQEQRKANHSIGLLQKVMLSKQEERERLEKKIGHLRQEYEEMLSRPPKERVIDVPRYIDTPRYIDKIREIPKEVLVERVVEVPKIVEIPVEVEKPVEVEVNYKTMAEKALNAFRIQSEWLQSKGLDSESYNDLCHDMDYLQTNKTVYPRNRARVAPLRPDGDESHVRHGR